MQSATGIYPPLEQTWTKLQKHFKVTNDKRKCLLTSEGAGCHSANAAQASASAQLEQALAALTNLNAAANAATDVTPACPHQSAPISNAGWHYCWPHGLGQILEHTSHTCANRSVGHREDAVVGHMMGGNNSINRRRGKRSVYRCSYNTFTSNT
jgi:hypothetical protein